MDSVAARALIFDLDGTVWDSAGWFAAALASGRIEAADRIRTDLIAGSNIVGALKQAKLTRARLLIEAQRLSGPPPLFPDVAEALAILKGRGVPLAVATSLPGTLALPMLSATGLASIFDAVVHAGVCRTPKPHPASLHAALRMIGQAAGPDVYYVGDRATDAAAAMRAGVSAAWMLHGYEQPAANSGIVAIGPTGLLEL